MRLSEILKGVERETGEPIVDRDIERITNDSRKVKDGDLFIAFRGYAKDGYDFIDEALRRGAKAVIAEKDFNAPADVVKILIKDTRTALPVITNNFYNYPSRGLEMIGVTGTNGKTTITYIIESMLNKAGKKSGVIGTINHRFGGKVMPAANTTPGPIEIASMLAEMAAASVDCAVMEASSHALDQRRLDGILFDAAIFTNITPEHLDYHKTMEEYFNAKSKIFSYLKKGGIAILNNDDPKVAALKNSVKAKVVTYGLKNNSDITAKNIRLSLGSSKFDIIMPGRTFSVTTSLIGRHNISNILAAAAACASFGIDYKEIKSGIEAIAYVPGRLENIERSQPFSVFVDFAHTEDALYNILSLLREISKDYIIAVFGCGGNRDRTKRPLMGQAACKLSDHVIITSDNPRDEEPASIIDEIVNGVRGKFSNYEIEPDRRKAIGKALDLAKIGSIVVIAGKGHETGQIIKDKVLPFDDREVVREALKECSCRE